MKAANHPFRVPHQRKALTVPPGGRTLGTEIVAGKGSGKTTFLTCLALEDYLKGRPQVILDPLGTVSDSLLFRISRFLTYVPPALHPRYWERLRYVDLGATDFVVPFPIYRRRPSDRSLREVAEHFLTVIRLSNPALANAPIMGMPAMRRIGVYAGMVLASLGFQLTEAHSLLFDTAEWDRKGLFAEALTRCPEVAPAINFFTQGYLSLREFEKGRLITSFLDHIFPFTVDPVLCALFSASTPGLSFAEVEKKGVGETVILDFRNLLDPETRRFALLWVFSELYDFIKRRGRNPQPFGLIIDEFAALAQQVTDGVNPLATLLDEFINQYMRNHNIWLTVAHQSLLQIDEQLRTTLLSLGNYVIGRVSTMVEARILADALFTTDVFRIKHMRNVWGSSQQLRTRQTLHYVIDQEPEFMKLDEQQELYAQAIKQLRLFDFLLRPAEGEGQVSSSVIPITIANFVRDRQTGEYIFPQPEVVAPLRVLLAAKSGIPIRTIQQEIEARLRRFGLGFLPEPRSPSSVPAPDGKHLPINRRELLS